MPNKVFQQARQHPPAKILQYPFIPFYCPIYPQPKPNPPTKPKNNPKTKLSNLPLNLEKKF
jgi:hypothetical protein